MPTPTVPTGAAEGTATRATGAITVLVVDDDPLLRELYAAALTRDGGFDVVGQAHSGAEAVDVAARVQPDLALVDVRISGLQGPELLRALAEVAPNMRVVMASGHATEAVAARLLDVGAWGLVRKGGSPDELCDQLRSVAGADDRSPTRVAPQEHGPGRSSLRRLDDRSDRELAGAGRTARRRPRSVVVGWLVAVLVVGALATQAWAWQRDLDQSAEATATAEVALTAERVDAQVRRRVAGLRAAAEGLLGGPVDDGELAEALLPLGVPFALLIDVEERQLLASLPPRDRDVDELVVEFSHIAAAMEGQLGVGTRLVSDDGRVGTGIAIPYGALDQDARVLSSVLWFDESEIRETLASAARATPGVSWRLVDAGDALLAEEGALAAAEAGRDVQRVVAVGDLGWELVVEGPASSFGPALGTARVVPVAMAVAGGVLALVLALAWQRMVRTSRRLAVANATLQDLQDQQREFAAVTAHELRTPVTVVDGFAQTLQLRWGAVDDETRRDMLDRLASAARRLSGLVEDLMTATLSERGALHLVPRPMTAATFVDAAMQGSRMALAPPEVLDLEGHAVLRVDPIYGPRMLANLLDNAVKYGRRPVEAYLTQHDGYVDIVVRDHGDGVPADFESRLFQPFRQAEGHERRRRGGVGLGLHTVATLAELSGGTIRYRPADGGGAEFHLRLPAARPGSEVVA